MAKARSELTEGQYVHTIAKPGTKTPQAAAPSAGPVADTGRIARRPVADPTELNARTPPRARATAFTRLEVCPGWFVKTLDALLLPGENRRVKLTRLARERVFRGQPGSAPSDGPGRRAAGSGGKAPARRCQASRYPTSRSDPGEVASGRGELDGIRRARRAAGCLRFGRVARARGGQGVADPPRRAEDRSPPGAALDGRALPLVGLDRAPSPAPGGGSAHACHLARLPRSRRDLQSLGQQGRAALRSLDGGRRCSRLDRPGGGTQAVGGRRAGDGRPLAALSHLAPRPASRAARRHAGQGTPAGLPVRLADPLAALGRGSRRRGEGNLERASRGRSEALDPPSSHHRGQV